jgi:hypothetical protein
VTRRVIASVEESLRQIVAVAVAHGGMGDMGGMGM